MSARSSGDFWSDAGAETGSMKTDDGISQHFGTGTDRRHDDAGSAPLTERASYV